jgi:lipopolysaccharide/colanic/teichoic acid biosynthesis glycosyltransferase
MATITLYVYLYPYQTKEPPDASTNGQLYPDLRRKTSARLLKRALDILGSLVLLVLLAPLFVVVGVVIKLTSKGPVLFKQTRIGQFGQPFTLLKFRSMYTHANSTVHEAYVRAFILSAKDGHTTSESLKQGGLFKLNGDPRITPLGHFLRQTSLDELPQIFNVLMGSMSLVGPRPPMAYEVACYEPWHMRRVLEARPGITGLWQVRGRSRTTFEEMVRLDLKYIDGWSIWVDLKLLLQTPWAVLRGEGAR